MLAHVLLVEEDSGSAGAGDGMRGQLRHTLEILVLQLWIVSRLCLQHGSAREIRVAWMPVVTIRQRRLCTNRGDIESESETRAVHT
jgi:hypothetical protein